MKVPFVDLKALVAEHRDEYQAALESVLDSAYFAGGPEVAAFEEEFANYCNQKFAVAVSSGTDALILALKAAGVGVGDEVITAPNSFFATAEAISHVGATPVFADVRDSDLLLCPKAAEAVIGPKTKAIIPVHLYGQMADMKAFSALCKKYELCLLEDSAQAHGAERDGLRAGSVGIAAGFSFYPAKNLGAFGEGGAVTSGSEELAAKVRRLRDHGQATKHQHIEIGYNARLPAILCAALRVGLRHLELGNKRRRKAAQLYCEKISQIPELKLVEENPDSHRVHHLFVVRSSKRDWLMESLKELGIATAIHYPRPIHLQAAYKHLGYAEGSFPVAEKAASEILSLPIFPSISESQIESVVSALKQSFHK